MSAPEKQQVVGGESLPPQNLVANIRLKCLEYANSLNRDTADVVERARAFEAYVLGAPQAKPAQPKRQVR